MSVRLEPNAERGGERSECLFKAREKLLAALAKAASLIVVTNNEREFKRVKGLKVENWAA